MAALTATMAAIHIHLWSTGYRHVHFIGVLFLLNAIGGIALAAALLIAPGRLLGLVTAMTTLFTAGTLLGLVLSLTTGLLGFHEFLGAPFLNDTLAVESAGIVAGTAATAVFARGWGRDHRPGRFRRRQVGIEPEVRNA